MNRLTIVLTGGGTGGHITPVLAVADELKKLRPDIHLVYIGERGGVLTDLLSNNPAIDVVYTVWAGKFRRYKGDGWRQLLAVKMQLLNIRDAGRIIAGIWQSYWLIRRLRPNIILTRGGYVSVPVALGGKLNNVPFITHDSDSTPSLANHLIGRWAAVHAVGMAPELYAYPQGSAVMVGVPVSEEYRHVTQKLQQEYRRELGLPITGKILFVTGGGNGAESLNLLIANNSHELLRRYPDLTILLTAGRQHEASLNALYDRLLDSSLRQRVVVRGFLHDMYRYSGAADLIVARAGATTLAELAIQGKPVIVIPAAHLTWQVHQARTLAERSAIIDLSQAKAEDGQFVPSVTDLLDDPNKREQLANSLHQLAVPDAAARVAMLLLDKMRVLKGR